MKLSIVIECDNAAFADDFVGQVADLLDDCRDTIEAKGETFTEKPLFDFNGNKVGRMTLEGGAK
jgi:hypothetical protein